MSLLASQTRKASPGGFGSALNCVPKIVLFDVKWTYFGRSLYSAVAGMYV